MRAGTLKSTITIQQLDGTRLGSGQPDPDAWADYLVGIRADILHQSGSEANRAETQVSIVKASIRIRYAVSRLAITAGMRVLHGTTVYDIKAVIPDERGHQHIDLVCETGANDG